MAKLSLVFCGDKYHPADMVLSGLRAAGGVEFDFEPAPLGSEFEIPTGTSLVVIAKLNVHSPEDPAPWTTDTLDSVFGKFVEEGHALLVIHGGTVLYAAAPAIRSMTGGTFTQHPSSCDVRLEIANAHPIAEGIPSFSVFDEHYFMDVDSGLDVFLQARSEHGVQPAGWTKPYGMGKVCVLTPGHGAEVWERPEYLQLLRNALHWLTNE